MVARFGLMHVVATNLCVWIRTLVLESIKEITKHNQKMEQMGSNFLSKFNVAQSRSKCVDLILVRSF